MSNQPTETLFSKQVAATTSNNHVMTLKLVKVLIAFAIGVGMLLYLGTGQFGGDNTKDQNEGSSVLNDLMNP